MPREHTDACVGTLQRWGFDVMIGKTVGGDSENYFSATDEDRLFEMQAMLDTPEINAILCGRGGYGSSRIIDQLNFKQFKKYPKWIIGFSDITVFHAHCYRRLGIASLHGPMANAFRDPNAGPYLNSLHQALRGKKYHYQLPANPLNRPGEAIGPLVGGNLSLLIHLLGTRSFPKLDGAILFLEDVGEQLYNLDRMLLQLHRNGVLESLGGLILGGFTDCRDTTRPFGETIEQLLSRQTAQLSIPVAFDFPVSHDTANLCLRHGGMHQLRIGKNQKTSLREI